MSTLGGGIGHFYSWWPMPFTMSVKANIDEALRNFRARTSNVPLATAKALTFTAERVRDAERTEMRRVFDRPTPFTISSLYLKSATPSRLEARVYFKDLRNRAHYLEPQVYGGSRPLKRFEQFLQRAGMLPVGMYVVPGAGAKLDAYGNMSQGQLVQILSALQALPQTGYLANKSKRKGARKNKLTSNIFAGRPRPGMPLGVWLRKGLTGLSPLLIFVRQPRYTQRFKFYEVAQTTASREFDAILTRELQRPTIGVGIAA